MARLKKLSDGLIAFFLTCSLTFVALCFRTTGIHLDEGAYLTFSQTKMFGDSKENGKPTLFYPLNYFINKYWGSGLHVQPYYAIYFFYIAFFALAIAFLTVTVGLTRSARLKLLVLVIVAPLYVLNATELMTETALLPFCTFAFVCLWCAVGAPRRSRWAYEFLFMSLFFVAILFKVTVVPAFLALACPYIYIFNRDRRRAPLFLTLAVPVLLGAVVNSLSIKFLPGQQLSSFGLNFTWVDFKNMLKRALFIPSYVYTWLFFVGPVAYVTFKKVWRFRFNYFQKPLASCSGDELIERWLIATSSLTLLATVAFNPVSFYELARYAYPSIWMGFLAMAALLARESLTQISQPLALNLLLVLTLVTNLSHRFAVWPTIITREFFYSGCHVFQGTRLHGWMLFNQPQNKPICLLITEKDGEQNYLLRQFFSQFTQAKLFDESSRAAFDQCTEPKGFIRRQFNPQVKCPSWCDDQKTFWRACATQPIVHGVNTGELINESCLP